MIDIPSQTLSDEEVREDEDNKSGALAERFPDSFHCSHSGCRGLLQSSPHSVRTTGSNADTGTYFYANSNT